MATSFYIKLVTTVVGWDRGLWTRELEHLQQQQPSFYLTPMQLATSDNGKRINRSTNHLISQPTNQLTNHPTSQPSNHQVKKLKNSIDPLI